MTKLNKYITTGLILGSFLTAAGTIYAKDSTSSGVIQPRKGALQVLQEKIKDSIDKIRVNTPGAAIGSGEVTAIDGTTLVVTHEGKSISVLTDANTQFRFRYWGPDASFADIKVGHKINAIGHWTDDTKTTLLAKHVRDLSLEKRFGVIVGKVVSVSQTGIKVSPVSEKRADQVVTVSGTTKLVNKNGQTITKSELKVGDRVMVKGLWDISKNTVTDVTQIKDFN